MLAIRMQRTGRKGHAMFRVVVQDSRRTPSSGKVVARLGSYDPHSKTLTIDKEKASFYLEHGAQPSDRIVVLLSKEGVKLPKWAVQPANKESSVRNPDKRRSTRPAEEVEAEAPAAEETPASEEAPAEEPAAEEAPAEAAPAEETVPEETAEKAEEKTSDDAESDASEETE